ncbi:MAG: ABC transporter permease [Hyphomicrobiaceae bacterium]
MTVNAAPQTWRAWLTAEAPQSRLQAQLGRAYASWRSLAQNPLALVGLVIILLLALLALLAPVIAPYSPVEQDLTNRLQPATAAHPFGTDELGRDIFSRLLYGSRITLLIIFLVSIIVLPLGLAIGTASGYFGGLIDTVLMRVTDIFLAFPRLILALAFAAALGPGIENAVIAISLTAWPPYARLARAETLTIRKSEFIDAARMQGATSAHILANHVVPICLPSVLVRLTLDMAGIVLTAAGLGFLGLGAQPPMPEWGLMIANGRQYLLDQWWVSTVPGLAIFVISLAFNLLGDGLRDALDSRSS